MGNNPTGVAFDGVNIWVANYGSSSVTRLRAKDGKSPKFFQVSGEPVGVAFDGVYIWVANSGSGSLTKIEATKGVHVGEF